MNFKNCSNIVRKNKFNNLLVLLMILFFSCCEKEKENITVQIDECEDLFLGKHSLDEETINFVDYEFLDTVIFVNILEEEMKFICIGNTIRDVEEEIKKINCESRTISEIYTRQHKQLLLRADSSVYLAYLWNNRNHSKLDSIMTCDIFSIHLVINPGTNSQSCKGNISLNCDELDPLLDFDNIDLTNIELIGVQEINGIMYENVYKVKDCEFQILLVKGIGVIQFATEDDQIWYFDRVL